MDDDKWKNLELTRWTATLVALCLLCVSAHRAESKEMELPPAVKPVGEGEPNVVAQSAAVIDSYTGEFLFVKNENALQYPASSTKILTALLVIEAGDLDKSVTIDLSDTKVEPSNLELKPGEQYTRRQLLYGLMLKSANDVAMALARDNAGSVEAFAEKMNRRAEELGATNSHFANPHGLHRTRSLHDSPRSRANCARCDGAAIFSPGGLDDLLHLEVAKRHSVPATKS